jgi:hypothetical protein
MLLRYVIDYTLQVECMDSAQVHCETGPSNLTLTCQTEVVDLL